MCTYFYFRPCPPQIRINTISAGPLGSRAAKAIGFIDDMIRYSYENAPIQKELAAKEVRVWGLGLRLRFNTLSRR